MREHHWWAAALVLLGTLGLATGFIRVPGFWSNYVLDVVGPAWNYILIRGLFSRKQPTTLSRLFGPEVAIVVIIVVCVLIEGAQYLQLYDAHYDPYDFVAYVSLVLPCYVIDRWRLQFRCRRASAG